MPTPAEKQKAAEARRKADEEAAAAKAAEKKQKAADKQKAAEEKRIAEEQKRKTVKPRSTLNSGGVGRVSQFLSSSKDRLSSRFSGSRKSLAARDNSNASLRSTHSLPQQRDRSAESDYPRQQYQEQQQEDPAGKMSTPLASPSMDRRSPAKLINSEDNSALSSINPCDMVCDMDDDEIDQLVLSNPSPENVQIMADSLRRRVEDFGFSFQDQENWKDFFEDDGETLLLKIEALRRKCSNLKLQDQIVMLTQLQGKCEKYIEQLRSRAEQERSMPPEDLIVPSKLTPGRDADPFRPASKLPRSPLVPQPGNNHGASPLVRQTSERQGAALIPIINIQPADDQGNLRLEDGAEVQYCNPISPAKSTSDARGAPNQPDLIQQVQDLVRAMAVSEENRAAMLDALSKKANASELAQSKADILRVQQLLSQLDAGLLKANIDQLQRTVDNVAQEQTGQNRVIQQIFERLDKNARDIRSLDKDVKGMLRTQSETNSEVKLLKEVTNADLIPRGFTPGRRVNFPNTPQGQEALGGGRQSAYPGSYRTDRPRGGSPDRFNVSDAFRQSRRMPEIAANTGIPGIARHLTPATTTVAARVTTTVTTSGITTSAQSMSSAVQNVMAPAQGTLASPFSTYNTPAGGYTPVEGGHHGGTPLNGSNLIENDRAQALNDDANRLIARLVPRLDDEQLDKKAVLGLHKSKLPGIENAENRLVQALDRYLDKASAVNMDVLSRVRSASSQAKDWANGIRDMYNALECNNKDFDDKLFSSLKKFSNKSDMSVFEFIAKFESYTKSKGDELKRADLLYNEYLDREIQERVVEFKMDYQAMKKCLFSTYGNVRNITSKLFSKLKENVPTDSASESELYRHYKGLNYAIQRTAEMTKVEGVPTTELENHIYSVDFIGMLKELLVPCSVKYEYMGLLENAGYCSKSPSGEKPFQMYVDKIAKRFKLIEDSVSESTKQSWKKPQVDKPRQKAAKSPQQKAYTTVVEVDDDASDDECQHAVHYTTDDKQGKQQTKPAAIKKQSSPPKQKQQVGKATSKASTVKFPCQFHKGKHEIGSCEDFFKAKAKDRKNNHFRAMCLNCLGPKTGCKGPCSNSIPKALVCEECVDYAKSNNTGTKNVLFCTFKNHAKPDKKDLSKALKKYLVGYDDNKMGSILVLHTRVTAFHCDCTKPCKCKSKRTKTSKPIENQPIPAFDTQSGKLCKADESLIIKESKEDTVYVTQIISINKRDVQVFYDRGANNNIIDGTLAEELKFKVVTDKPSTMGTLSQSRMVSEYGTYTFCLGSKDESFFELTAQGFDLSNQKFPYCNLNQINAEIVQAKKLPQDVKLPEFVGGMQIGILIGLKSPALEPQLVFQLPCGMGIYKSALKDKFGSRYCYGGPHEAFTKISRNKKLSANFSATRTYFTQMFSSYSRSFYPALSKAIPEELEEITEGLFSVVDKTPQAAITTYTGTTFEPTPLVEEDLQQMGYPTSHVHKISEDTGTGCIHPGAKARCTCSETVSVFKTNLPIAKRKEYIDVPDDALVQDTRCVEC